MTKLKKYRIFYRYWSKGFIVDGDVILKFSETPDKEKVFDRLVKKHNYPKNSRASKHSIASIKINEILSQSPRTIRSREKEYCGCVD